MRTSLLGTWIITAGTFSVLGLADSQNDAGDRLKENSAIVTPQDRAIVDHAKKLLEDGRDIFRHDTFGDEAFWGGELKLHRAIKGEALGGVGPGISPNSALQLGLKVD